MHLWFKTVIQLCVPVLFNVAMFFLLISYRTMKKSLAYGIYHITAKCECYKVKTTSIINPIWIKPTSSVFKNKNDHNIGTCRFIKLS